MILELLAAAHDYRPGIPDPPVGVQANTVQQAAFTAICGIPTALAIGIAIRFSLKHRNHLWGLFLLGGAFAMLVEPIFDYMGGVWWPLNSWEAFNLMGVNVPWLVPLVYPWLIGGNSYLTYRLLERGITPRYYWMLTGFFCLENFLLETTGVTFIGTYAYFGQQPLNPWGLPLWYVACNGPGFMMPGVFVYLLRNHLRRGLDGAVTTVALFPMAYICTYALIGFPGWISVNSGWSFWPAQAAGVLCWGLMFIVVRGITQLVCTPEAGGAQAPLWKLANEVLTDRYWAGFQGTPGTATPAKPGQPTSTPTLAEN